jgi:hypothetical protein
MSDHSAVKLDFRGHLWNKEKRVFKTGDLLEVTKMRFNPYEIFYERTRYM